VNKNIKYQMGLNKNLPHIEVIKFYNKMKIGIFNHPEYLKHNNVFNWEQLSKLLASWYYKLITTDGIGEHIDVNKIYTKEHNV
jgi:hypothetical protein